MLAELAKQYPIQRNSVLRLFEPLGAPNEDDIAAPAIAPGATVTTTAAARSDDHGQRVNVPLAPSSLAQPQSNTLSGVSIVMQGVTVHAGGHTILRDINLTIRAGEHIAIVGSSGAGKSSLVGLLLGWHRPASGHILVDDTPLVGEYLHALRRVTAWVDPTVQLWNRPLLDNLRYGAYGSAGATMGDMLEQADLLGVLERLPNGLRTTLGEGGGLVSGGEGQRVRLGRALWRPDVRLAILDEPFRGLDRSQRRRLLANARQHWKSVTLVCITHDVGETQDFARLVVIEEGRIVEDAAPNILAAQPDSRYHALLEAEAAVQGEIWTSAEWRRLWLEEGRLHER
jgi:ATP-binding cassette subfamily B protein